MIIAFIIWSIVAILFLGIGISCLKSKEAVGFFTFTKPPVMAHDKIAKYNRAVAILWFTFAVLFELIGVPTLFIQQNSPVFMPIMFGVVILVIAVMIAYMRIEGKYTK